MEKVTYRLITLDLSKGALPTDHILDVIDAVVDQGFAGRSDTWINAVMDGHTLVICISDKDTTRGEVYQQYAQMNLKT